MGGHDAAGSATTAAGAHAGARSGERHLVWDWNGTLLADLPLVVAAANAVFDALGGPRVTPEHHRQFFRRPISDYYSLVLGRTVPEIEFVQLNKLFHDAYEAGLAGCPLTDGAADALRAWGGRQSLLSMWFHADLVPAVEAYGLTEYFVRIDGRDRLIDAGDHKLPYLVNHLAALRLDGADVVLIGDTVDDAVAATAAGAKCVLYSGGHSGVEPLRGAGVPVTDTLAEAVALARTV
jgi:phosphoglycolate phosphatase-like HAD superfamily hydrolase